MNRKDKFMSVFMFELEEYLNQLNIPPNDISFNMDEANTDRPIKLFIKNIIKSKLNNLAQSTITQCIFYDECFDISEIKKIYISDVLLQDELTEEHKDIIKDKKQSNYTNPDLFLVISDENDILYDTIEIKSTNTDKIPGSSVQQINIDEWTLFVLHNKNFVKFATSQYIHAIDNKIQFPDRSPRPEVSFSEVIKYNSNHRLSNKISLNYEYDPYTADKISLILDWQNYLAQKWTDEIFKFDTSSRKAWFSNALRKFVLTFLNKYDNLSKKEQELLKKKIINEIE